MNKLDIIIYMRQRKDDRRKTFQTLTLITQLGLVMIVAMGMTTAAGIWLDRKLGTSFFTVILFFLGAAGGCQGVYRMVKQIFRDEYGKDDGISKKER